MAEMDNDAAAITAKLTEVVDRPALPASPSKIFQFDVS